MKTRPFCVSVVLLLLLQLFRFGEGTSNPGFIARITKKGIEYAHQYGMASLKKELSTFRIPDFSGDYHAGWFLSVSYEFYNLQIRNFQLPNSDLSLLPTQGVRATVYNSYLYLQGSWKVKKGFITLEGTFDVKVSDIFISVSLNLAKGPSGRPRASVSSCSNSIGHISVTISGHLSWILNLFHERIENNLKQFLEKKTRLCWSLRDQGGGQSWDYIQNLTENPDTHQQRFKEICEIIRTMAKSQLQPYLQTLPVTAVIDSVAGIDYRLIDAPKVTSTTLDTFFKAGFFHRSGLFSSPFSAPPIQLPQVHNHMVYFAVSEYVFNTASWVYHKAGSMNFTIQNEHLKDLKKLSESQQARELRRKYLNPGCPKSMPSAFTSMASCFLSSFILNFMQLPLDANIRLNTDSFQAAIPRLTRLYPKMELELDVSPESAPLLKFTPGNVTVQAVIDVQAFVVLANSSVRKSVFQLRASTNISAIITVQSTRILGSVSTGSKLKLELKRSDIGFFNVELMESLLNYFALHTIYPVLNAKLEEGFPLPLPVDTSINSPVLQAYEVLLDFLSVRGEIGTVLRCMLLSWEEKSCTGDLV